MSSYQQIDTRLAVLEDMLEFVMTTCRMTGIVQGPGAVLGPNGRPVEKEGSLLDWYKLIKQSGSRPALQSDSMDAEIVNETVNG